MSHYSTIASRYGIDLIYELFADRNYTDDGALVPRGEEGAVMESTSEIVEAYRALQRAWRDTQYPPKATHPIMRLTMCSWG